ncbi:alkaline phosphatase [Pelosinus baikalensis]|uniref:alkaline phosphatase n=1 Tax=Pelosinus baikalensis TaxID=2892015 RepID=UPI002101EEAF|nr:alkaline phosphatase [Pelosinus baikalensis]
MTNNFMPWTDWQRATYDTIEMDKAVGIAKEFAKKNGDTLIIVVADHAHGASITGTYHEKDGKTGREAVRIYADAGWLRQFAKESGSILVVSTHDRQIMNQFERICSLRKQSEEVIGSATSNRLA